MRPASPTKLTKLAIHVFCPYTAMRASTNGALESFNRFATAAPTPKTKIKNAKAAKINIEPIRPRGNDLAGSLASSAANGTPSTAKKNQIA